MISKEEFKDLKADLMEVGQIQNSTERIAGILSIASTFIDADLNPQELLKSNSKLSNDTVALNTDLGLSCINKHNGKCHLTKNCYAIRFERMYKNKLIKSLKQVYYFYTTPAEQIIQDILDSKASYVRINEAGDLNNFKQVEKIKIIAQELKKHGVKCYLYSKNTLYYNTLKHILIWNDSTGSITEAKQYISIRNNKAGRKLKTPLNRVCQGNCKKCNTCRSEEITRTFCYYH